MVEICPRCHGKLYGKPRSKARPTLRVDNVMGSTHMIHYRCSNCGYTEQKKYDSNGTTHTVIDKHYKQITLNGTTNHDKSAETLKKTKKIQATGSTNNGNPGTWTPVLVTGFNRVDYNRHGHEVSHANGIWDRLKNEMYRVIRMNVKMGARRGELLKDQRISE